MRYLIGFIFLFLTLPAHAFGPMIIAGGTAATGACTYSTVDYNKYTGTDYDLETTKAYLSAAFTVTASSWDIRKIKVRLKKKGTPATKNIYARVFTTDDSPANAPKTQVGTTSTNYIVSTSLDTAGTDCEFLFDPGVTVSAGQYHVVIDSTRTDSSNGILWVVDDVSTGTLGMHGQDALTEDLWTTLDAAMLAYVVTYACN